MAEIGFIETIQSIQLPDLKPLSVRYILHNSGKEYIETQSMLFVQSFMRSYAYNDNDTLDNFDTLGLFAMDSVSAMILNCFKNPCVTVRIACLKLVADVAAANNPQLQRLIQAQENLLRNLKNLVRVSESQLAKYGIDAHSLKEAALKGVDATKKLSRWEIFRNPKTNELFIRQVHGGTPTTVVNTGEYMK